MRSDLILSSAKYARKAVKGFERVSARGAAVAAKNLVRLGTTPQWNAFQAVLADPSGRSSQTLQKILSNLVGTQFGRDHGITGRETFDDYRTKIPIRDYAALQPYFDRVFQGEADVLARGLPRGFGVSSGSTGTAKHLPFYVERPNSTLSFVSARLMFARFPRSFLGPTLTLRSVETIAYSPGNIPMNVGFSGDETPGLEAAIPKEVYHVADHSLQQRTILRLAAQQDLRVIETLNPSTAVVFAKLIEERADLLGRELASGTFGLLDELPERARSVVSSLLRKRPDAAKRMAQARGTPLSRCLWPNLQVVSAWQGGSAALYLPSLRAHFPACGLWDPGYMAKEQFFAAPLAPDSASGVVNYFGVLLEFLPEFEDPAAASLRTRLGHELEAGQTYRVIVNNLNGLYRYDMHDIVICDGHTRGIAQIRFLYRDQSTMSFTGEKITEHHVAELVSKLRAAQVLPDSYCIMTGKFADPPYYILAIEADPGNAARLTEQKLESLASAADEALGAINVEYQRKRRTGRLGALEVLLLPMGAHQRLYDERRESGAREGRIKLPWIVRDAEKVLRLV